MGKTFLSSIILTMVMLFTACSNDSFVGEWVPDNSTSGENVMSINSDGTVELYVDTEGGSYSIKGTWSHVEGNDNSIKVNYNPSTIRINLENPLEAVVVEAALKELGSNTLSLTISDDGERLDGGGNGYFVRY
mgnify:CR=1 FL=1